MSTDSTPGPTRRRRRVVGHVGLFVAIFAASYVATQLILADRTNREALVATARASITSACEAGLRLPGIDCPQPPKLVKRGRDNPDESLARSFARLPGMPAAVEKLQWTGGTGADAARLLAVLKTIELSRTNQARRNHKAIGPTAELLAPVWRDHPELVAASACVFCGIQGELLAKLLDGDHPSPERVQEIFIGDPELMRALDQGPGLDEERRQRLARLHGYLSHPGSPDVASYIGQILARADAPRALRNWALTGPNTVAELPLEELPRETVVTAWRSGIAEGAGSPAITRYLLSNGYRPALRLLMWYEGSDLDYLKGHGYRYRQEQYRLMMDEYVAFSDRDGHALADFYSRHWRDIDWNRASQQWQR